MLSLISSEGSVIKYHSFHRCCCPPQWPQQHSVSAKEGTGAPGIFIPECTCRISIFVCPKMNIPGQNSPNDNQAEIVVVPPDRTFALESLRRKGGGSQRWQRRRLIPWFRYLVWIVGYVLATQTDKSLIRWGWVSGGEILILCPSADHFRVNLLGRQEVGEWSGLGLRPVVIQGTARLPDYCPQKC